MNFLSELANSIQPYTAGEQLNDKSYVKLNTNENPYAPSPKVSEVIKNLDVEKLKLYPAPNADALRDTIAIAEGVERENVFCGNGSDEVLALCFPTFFDPNGGGAAFADITYSFYKVYADFFSVDKKIVPLKEDYTMDFNGFKNTDCQGYFITNPNAPTGIGESRETIEDFIKCVQDKIVILDEAYMGFYGESCVELTKKYKNVLVVKTFSKYYSLAGIRCGYAIGDKALVEGLFKCKDCFNSYPLDHVCQLVCKAAIEDSEYYNEKGALVIEERERVREELIKLGFNVPESKANFLFAENKKFGGKYIYEKLKENGVLVRFWNSEKLKNFCRITVGSKEQNDVLLLTLKNILS